MYSLDVYMLYLFIQSPLIIAYILGLILFTVKKSNLYMIFVFFIVLIIIILDPWITSSFITAQNTHLISLVRTLINALPLIFLIYLFVKKDS